MIRFEPKPPLSPSANPAIRRTERPVCDDETILREMADEMRRLAFSGQTVDERALQLGGFTLDQIERLGPSARDLANILSTRRVAA